jgi:hypothetical protein
MRLPENVVKHAETNRKNDARYRTELIVKLGAICVCCGETEPKFLTFDHIGGNGGYLRRTGIHKKIHLKVRTNPEILKEIQLLCWNCNGAKGAYGVCPHEIIKQESDRVFQPELAQSI